MLWKRCSLAVRGGISMRANTARKANRHNSYAIFVQRWPGSWGSYFQLMKDAISIGGSMMQFPPQRLFSRSRV